MAQATERLEAIVEPAVSALGFELVGIEYLSQGKHSMLRIYIDSDDGITVDDCAKVSHQVSGVLDVEDPIRGEYTLEISSPGLDRPLFKAADYDRFAGQEIKVRLAQPREGRRNYSGVLLGVRDGEVVLTMDGQEIGLPLADIEKANLVPKW